MYILGISCFYHDSAACLLHNGEIIGAVQEERFTRVKHDQSFPKLSIQYLLNNSNIKISQIDFIVFYEKPIIKFDRILTTHLDFSPRGFRSFCNSMPIWIKQKLFQKKTLLRELKSFGDVDSKKLLFSEHHLSHAASSFFTSGFEKSSIITLDGVGEYTTTAIGYGDKDKIFLEEEIQFPHSIGLLYSAFTYYCGFRVNSGEYKLMGLAPYGNPIYKDKILNNLLDLKEDGSFRLNLKYFKFHIDLEMTSKKFDDLFNTTKRKSDTSDISQIYMDLAASIQKVTEEIVLKISKKVKNKYNHDNLCLSGGVALNCVANGILKKEKIFKNIFIQPAAGDAGGSLGAALYVWHKYSKKQDTRRLYDNNFLNGSYLGPKYSTDEILKTFDKKKLKYKIFEDKNNLLDFVSEKLIQGKSIGWFQGRMEFGPRALGARSILADPRNENVQKDLNLKIKFRESFRPFAPSVLKEYCKDWFEDMDDSPYMLFVTKVKENKVFKSKNISPSLSDINNKRSQIPAVTHVDFTARVQTVDDKSNKIFYDLLKTFNKKTGCPILVNTSFNVRGEPIVCSPEDAYKCFMGTNLDLLVCENVVALKEDQDIKLTLDYQSQFELD